MPGTVVSSVFIPVFKTDKTALWEVHCNREDRPPNRYDMLEKFKCFSTQSKQGREVRSAGNQGPRAVISVCVGMVSQRGDV